MRKKTEIEKLHTRINELQGRICQLETKLKTRTKIDLDPVEVESPCYNVETAAGITPMVYLEYPKIEIKEAIELILKHLNIKIAKAKPQEKFVTIKCLK